MTDYVYGACGVDALRFPDLDYEVHRAVLTPEQVREYGLPSRPLKETERRGDAWRTQMGIEQTEIDALASLPPDLLRRSHARPSNLSSTTRLAGV